MVSNQVLGARLASGVLTLSLTLTGCALFHHSANTAPPAAAPAASAAAVSTPVAETAAVPDMTATEAAVAATGSDTHAAAAPAQAAPMVPASAVNPSAPRSYVVKRGDTLWGISKVFLRDPWYWPEIWQVNPQIKNPHRIYPGDTLRLVYIDGRPKLIVQPGELRLEQGGDARVEPRVRSTPYDGAVTTIPYEAVAAFMSKPTVLSEEQIKGAPYVLAARDLHLLVSDGDIVYARGFTGPAELGMHYNMVRVGDALRDPDDNNRLIGYDGVYLGTGHVTRQGDPVTLVMTESARETEPGDKLIPGGVDVPLDFIPSPPKVKVNGVIISVNDGVEVIGQYQVVVINRGARDGLVPGNVLGIYDTGPVVDDNYKKGFLNSMTHLGEKKVQLPSERSGTFMVFKTFDSLSYGLVMEATNVIQVNDKVENP
jgi:LysM repeat protein